MSYRATSSSSSVGSASRRLHFSPTTAVVEPIVAVDASAQKSHPGSIPTHKLHAHDEWQDSSQYYVRHTTVEVQRDSDVTATNAANHLTVTSPNVDTSLRVNQSYEMTMRYPTSR